METERAASTKPAALLGNRLHTLLSEARKSVLAPKGTRIYVDITNSVLHKGKPFGILRVEHGLARELAKLGVTPVAWSDRLRAIVKLPLDCVEECTYKEDVRNALSANIIDARDRGAILIMPACQWWFNRNYMRDLTGIVRQHELRFVQWIHDVVWSKYAYMYTEKHVKDTSETTARIIREAAGILTYSRCAASDIHEFCQQHDMSCPPITLVRAADDFITSDHASMAKLEELRTGPGFVLYVSALQTRKNHRFLINLWRRLVEDLPLEQVPTLVLVAHGGQESDWFNTQVVPDATLKGKVQRLINVEDDEMNWLYKNCLFSVFPSLYEGWGLPVGESLAHGKICIATNLSSVPEIAPEHTDLIDPLDFASWYGRLHLYITDPEARKAREEEVRGYLPSSWADAAKKLLADLTNIELVVPDLEILPANKLISDFFHERNRRYFGGGWKRFDKDGAWSDSAATILFRLPSGISAADITLTLKIPQAGCKLDFLLNGQAVEKLVLQNANMALRCNIPIYPGSVRERGIQLEIHNRGGTTRSADFCLCSFIIAPVVMPEISAALTELEGICPPLSRAAEILASKYPDLRALANKPHGGLRLLFWAWRYGIGEDAAVRRVWKDIESSLKALHGRNPANALVSDYTALVAALRKVHSDISQWPEDTQKGQQNLVDWFNAQGISEYNLHDIV